MKPKTRKLAFMAALLAAFALSGCSRWDVPLGLQPFGAIEAAVSAEGTAYLPTREGTVLEVPGDAARAYAAPDGQHLVLQTAAGALSVADAGGETASVTQEAATVEAVRDGGFLYAVETERTVPWTVEEILQNILTDGNYTDTLEEAKAVMADWGFENTVEGAKAFYEYLLETPYDQVYDPTYTTRAYYRYTYDGGETLLLGEDVSGCAVSDGALSLLYAAEGAVYALPEGSETPEQLASLPEGSEAVLGGISPDGAMGFWAARRYSQEETRGTYTVYAFDGSAREAAVEECEALYLQLACYFTADSQRGVCGLYNGDQLLFLEKGQPCASVTLPGTLADGALYSANDHLAADTAGTWEELYLLVQDGETRDAYRVPWGGTPSRCFAGAERLVMKQGSAYYTDGSGTLYGARLEEGAMTAPEALAQNVYSFQPTTNGRRVFYLTDWDGETRTGTLCTWEQGEEAPQEIAQEAYHVYLPGTDQESVLYFLDAAYLEDSAVDCGALYRYTAGRRGGESTLVAENVPVYGVRTGYAGVDGELVNPDGFFFTSCSSTAGEDIPLGTLLYYDGETTIELAQEVLLP